MRVPSSLARRAARRLLRLPVLLYRWRLGFLLGHRFLLVEHVGRRSGHHYRTVVEVIGHQPPGTWYVMSGFGRTADWYRNVATAGSARIRLGRTTFTATTCTTEPAEAAAVLAEYEHRNRWLLPVIRPVLSRLVGWTYTGTESDRLRLVAQLPIVAFTAADAQR